MVYPCIWQPTVSLVPGDQHLFHAACVQAHSHLALVAEWRPPPAPPPFPLLPPSCPLGFPCHPFPSCSWWRIKRDPFPSQAWPTSNTGQHTKLAACAAIDHDQVAVDLNHFSSSAALCAFLFLFVFKDPFFFPLRSVCLWDELRSAPPLTRIINSRCLCSCTVHIELKFSKLSKINAASFASSRRNLVKQHL